MKKAIPLFCIGLMMVLSAGCGPKRDPAALKIGPVEISSSEFEEEFRDSRYVHLGARGRAEFLERYIDVRLILLEAERAGLDKDPDFLKDIQRFWEQALLKRALEQKNRALAHEIVVTRQDVEEYYARRQEDFQGRPLEEAYDQARWMVLKVKQSLALSDWTRQLREEAEIRVNQSLLGIEQ